MYVKAHCFLENARIDKVPIFFNFGDTTVQITNTPKRGETDEGMEIEITQKIEPTEIQVSKDEMDEKGFFIAQRLKKYKSKLQEVAFLIEGLLSVKYNVKVPPFNTGKVMVNVYPESEEERKMLNEGIVSRGFGDIFTPEKKIEFQWKDDVMGDINLARQHLPALSFFAQALRSQERGDQEIAFFLFFRILEGYFGDGSGHSEKSFIQNKNELSKYLKYDDRIKSAFKKILQEILKLPSKSKDNFEGLLSDIVLLRHKLTHFDANHSDRYFSPDLRFELDIINKYLRIATLLLIRNKIG
mgnify:CR=1 FL=1|jgi:hypothetical protein